MATARRCRSVVVSSTNSLAGKTAHKNGLLSQQVSPQVLSIFAIPAVVFLEIYRAVVRSLAFCSGRVGIAFAIELFRMARSRASTPIRCQSVSSFLSESA